MPRMFYFVNLLADKDALIFLLDGAPSMFKDAFLSRLKETGATESSSMNDCPNQMEEERESASERTKNILLNIVAATDSLWHLKDGLLTAVLKELPEDGKS